MKLSGQFRLSYLLLGIIFCYFLLRLPNLTYQPIFADEAIYIRWAQIAKAEPSLRFVSLQDGKTPLFMWLMAPFLQIFGDPLYAGRFLSVVMGFFTLLGTYFIGRDFFNRQVGLWTAFLVAITPFLIFFDRMALVDSTLAAFTVWVIYFGLKLTLQPSFKKAIILGLMLAGGWLTKTPGIVNIVLLPLFLLLYDFLKKPSNLVRFGGYLSFSAVLALGLYLIQRIDPNFHQLSLRNSDYVHPFSRLLQYPFDPLGVHFQDTLSFSLPFLGPILFLLPLVLIFTFFLKNKFAIVLALWSLIPIIYELEFIKAYTGRYILYSIPPLLILTGWLFDQIRGKLKLNFLTFLAIFLLILWPLYFTFKLMTDLANVPLSVGERRGYLEDWTAGYGLKSVAQFIDKQAQKETVIVGTEGSFGTLPEGVWIYLDKISNIAIKPGKYFIPDDIKQEAKKHPTYFIANRPNYLTYTDDAIILQKYLKIVGPTIPQYAIVLYQVKDQTNK